MCLIIYFKIIECGFRDMFPFKTREDKSAAFLIKHMGRWARVVDMSLHGNNKAHPNQLNNLIKAVAYFVPVRDPLVLKGGLEAWKETQSMKRLSWDMYKLCSNIEPKYKLCSNIEEKESYLGFHMNTGTRIMYAELVDTDTGVVLFTSS